MERVVVVDLGMGNLRSVERALARAAEDAGLAREVVVTRDPHAIARADRLVVPGQGAFRDAALALATGLGDAVREVLARSRPYLGICLGLQVLFASSEEAPGAAGLGVLGGRVVRLAPGARDETGAPVKIPHMGWNRIAPTRKSAGPLAVFDEDPPHVYFVHGYHAVPDDEALVAATAQHGPHRITAAVQRDHVIATQFHPEKSQSAGLAFLAAFLKA